MTRKLLLSVDDLSVEAFETTAPEPKKPRGTVEAQQTPTANSGGSCFDESCRPILCPTDYRCPTNRANCTVDNPSCIDGSCY